MVHWKLRVEFSVKPEIYKHVYSGRNSFKLQGRCGLGAFLLADRVLLEEVRPRLRLRYSGSRVRLRER